MPKRETQLEERQESIVNSRLECGWNRAGMATNLSGNQEFGNSSETAAKNDTAKMPGDGRNEGSKRKPEKEKLDAIECSTAGQSKPDAIIKPVRGPRSQWSSGNEDIQKGGNRSRIRRSKSEG
jgi:hypothetical protein